MLIQKFNVMTSILILVALSLGCADMNRKQKGALAGAAVGGVVGGASKGGKGAVIGAAGGAVAGGLIGAYLDKRQQELAQVVETQKTDRGLLITLKNDLLFDFDGTELRAGARQTLTELAEILVKYPEDDLRILGYTDHIGSEVYNQQLSEQRAEVVRDFLVSQGVTNDIRVKGMGEIPGTGDDPAAVAQNRKVEIYIDVAMPAQAQN